VKSKRADAQRLGPSANAPPAALEVVLVYGAQIPSLLPTRQHARVCGKVASAKYAESSRRSPTFLNLDEPYPNQVFTAVIWGDARPKFKTAPELLKGHAVCVTGTITLYKGRAEMEVSDPTQIEEVQGTPQ